MTARQYPWRGFCWGMAWLELCFSTLGIHKEVGFKTGKRRERKHPGATAIAVAKENKLQSAGHGSRIRKEEAQGS